MGNSHEQASTRREFLVYGVSAAATGMGDGAALLGTIGTLVARGNAKRDVEVTIQAMQERQELACEEHKDEEYKNQCLDSSKEMIDTFKDYEMRRKLYEHGEWEGKASITAGLGAVALGVTMKVVDSFIQRRSANKAY